MYSEASESIISIELISTDLSKITSGNIVEYKKLFSVWLELYSPKGRRLV